ncbi:MAG: poly-gamma-glutamate biosynthesis protein PgsC/CapC [Candidatus Contendobacter sp.]|nr:poly-gamma-glutamate biosynthesis protein PgsC/CapC [Candidatus Contendobacter sp.]
MLSLPLFPESLASSVVTTVWIGVTVAVFFSLRFGWSLSGLVVPGYLTPLLLLKPLSAAVVLGEGVVTYLIVHGLFERYSRYTGWSNLFGRDRFFALVLVSVAVRLIGDGWLLPKVGVLWNDYFQQDFDYRSELHSFGLVIVSLIANQFWKTGLRAGLVPLVVTVGLTFLIVRYGLMELTNFSVGNLGYMYNDLAASLLATPKAYIILLTTALLASRMNLHYGWEFNGILIPSLLALQWFQPARILASFFEAFLILGLARLLLRLPALARLHIEGPRALLFFFTLDFLYKLTLGWLLPLAWPAAPLTDIYGFGYLLSTLIAMRMYEKEIAARLTRATLQTSLVAVGVASIAGFALTLLPTPRAWLDLPPDSATTMHQASKTLLELINDDSVTLHRSRLGAGTPAPLPSELDAFHNGVEQLRAYLAGDQSALVEAARWLAAAHYQIYQVEQRYLYLREREPARGWGIYALDTRAAGNLLVEAPAPLDEPGALIASGWLFNALGGRALAVAGAPREVNADGSLDVLRSHQTLFQVFHQAMARRNVLQVRGYTEKSSQRLAGISPADFRTGQVQPPTTLWVQTALPPDLDLARLRSLVGEIQVRWAETPLPNLQRDTTGGGFAELILNRTDLRQILAQAVVAGQAEAPLQVGEMQIGGYLQEWLLADKRRLAERGSNLYRPPRLEELLYFDETVLTPLLAVLRTGYRNGEWTAEALTELRALAVAAGAVGYRLSRYQHRQSGQEYVILVEDETRDRRYWGTYVFRVTEPQPYLVAVPRPLFEVNSFEYGVALFDRIRAGALLLAGAHPQANQDGSADVANPANARSLFSLVHQVVLREARAAAWLTISVRAYGVRMGEPDPGADVLLACSGGATQTRALNPLGQKLVTTLTEDGMSLRFVDGAAATAGYETAGSPQARYLSAALNKEFCTVWLSPLTRAAFRQQSENIAQQAQFAALAIPTRQDDLYQYLATLPMAGGAPPPNWQMAAQAYMEQRDIVNLRQLQGWSGYRYLRLIDRDTQLAFLLTLDADGRLRWIINLAPRQPNVVVNAGIPPDAEAVQRFKDAQAGWLRFESSP